MAKTNLIPKINPATHDFTQNLFGHHLTILDMPNNGHILEVHGYAPNVLVNDYLLIKRGEWHCTYQVSKIHYDKLYPNYWNAELLLVSMSNQEGTFDSNWKLLEGTL